MWPFRNRDKHPERNSGESQVSKTRLSLSSEEKFRRIVRSELLRQQLAGQDSDTFEEADDFELDGDEEWVSPHENEFDPDFDHPADPPSPEPVEATPASPEPAKPSDDNGKAP